MRAVFMGTPEFAVPSLRALAEHHDVVAAYTRPDAASGRGRTLRSSPVKQLAAELGIEVRQPPTLREPAAVAELAALAPDVIVVAAYGLILPPEVLAVPPLGAINVHGSLLPRWRGAAPVQRAILAGDIETGVVIMQIEEGLDTGPFTEPVTVEIAGKSAAELTAELAEKGAGALIRALAAIEAGTVVWTPQDESQATYAAKIEKPDVALTPDISVADALRRVRASTPQAPARLAICGRSATVTEAFEAEEDVVPGGLACRKHALVIGFTDGSVLVERVKPDGKAEMPGCDWARGARFDDSGSWCEL